MASDPVTPHPHPEDGFSVIVDSEHQPPIPATIVSDQRDRLGRRLAVLGVGLLILFFAASGYIQSARNGHDLSVATRDRSQQAVTNAEQAKLLTDQNRLIAQLGGIIYRQGLALQKAGLGDQILTPPTQPPRPGKTADPSAPARPAPAPRQSPRKPPRSTPKPSPVRPTPSRLCLLPRPAPCITPPPVAEDGDLLDTVRRR